MQSKIIDRDEAARLSEHYKASGKTVGFTSGVFDILHSGHVSYLQTARNRVDLLIVGLNSDSSVKSNKGELRPICSQQERAEVLAGLSSVDHVFIFDELNNNRNVELIKPSVYIKAGDYSPEKLSSKGLVEVYGGRVELVPFVSGRSTTAIIERIRSAALSESISESGPEITYERKPAVFLDRDGTINEHIEYLSEPERFKAIPGAFQAIKQLRERGFRIIVVTNQPGIGLGYFTKEDLYAVNREMLRQASQEGAAFDRIYFCPHSKADNCQCRKPGTFFLARAESDLNVDLKGSYVIGDMTSDVQLGINAGCRSILVKSGRGGDDRIYQNSPDYTARDLEEAVRWIVEERGGGGY